MTTTFRSLIVLSFLCASLSATAQIQQPGTPLDWGRDVQSNTEIPMITTARLDMDIIRAEDAVVDRYKETPYRFGIEQEVSLDLFSEGLLTEMKKGDKVWQVGIHCPEATSINLHFKEFDIPVGGQLTIWSVDRKEYLGVFDHLTNKDYRSLAVGLIHSDRIVVEYYQQADVREQAALTIGTIVHGYRPVLDKWADPDKGPFGSSGSCNMNVNCPDGDDWQDEKRGVALILSGGSAVCTGSLVNNTAQDGTSYFLTASHCDGNENNWVFYFNHETSGCSGSSGPTNQSVSGANELASGSSSDYHLIQLSSQVPASYQPYYNGWDRSNSPVSTAVGIHHPAGDVKKISFDDDPLQKTSYLGTAISSNANHWRVETWERNTTTEGGSSGSPLFDQDHRIIGQLHGGYAACGNTTSDWYGAFNNSWSGLASILDPIGTGALTIDGLEGGGPAPTCSDGIQNQGETDVDCGGPCAPCSCDGAIVTLSITFDDYPQETSWAITSAGNTIASGGTYPNEPDGSTLNEFVCLPDGCYELTLFDSYGDGICCGFGNGYWSLSDDEGTVLTSDNSVWDDSITADFCIQSSSPCIGDMNGDQVVNASDFILFNSSFGMNCADCPADLDGDGSVDISDFTILNSAFGNTCPD